MFSFRFMSNGSHTLTAGEELVEWEAVKDHVHSTRVAAILGSAMLLLIGIPSLYLLYGAPHPQKIAAVSEGRAARSSGAGGAGIGTGSGSIADRGRTTCATDGVPRSSAKEGSQERGAAALRPPNSREHCARGHSRGRPRSWAQHAAGPPRLVRSACSPLRTRRCRATDPSRQDSRLPRPALRRRLFRQPTIPRTCRASEQQRRSSTDAAQARPPLVPGRDFCPLHRMMESV